MGTSKTLRTRLLSSQRSFNKYIFYDQKFFLQNEYIFKKDLYFICNTNIFCVKIYFWNEIYIFYIFIYIFLCKKKLFLTKKIFVIKLFFHIKKFFSANDIYFVIFFQKKQIFFQPSFATNEQSYATWMWMNKIKTNTSHSNWPQFYSLI